MSGSSILSNSIDPKNNGNSSGSSELNNSYNGNPSPHVPKLPPKKLTLSSFDDVTYSRDVPTSIPPPKMFHYHRELPRIATNGTLSRSNPQQQSQQQQQPLFQPQYQGKRKLPDRTKLPPPPPDPLNVPRTSNNNSQSGIGISSSNSSSTTTNSYQSIDTR